MTDNKTPATSDQAAPASDKPSTAPTQNPALILQSLNVALTEINHNYNAGEELIPMPLLPAMEQARPGTVAEYAKVLLAEPEHRRNMERHDNIRAYITLISNYLVALVLIAATFWLGFTDHAGGAIVSGLIVVAQIVGPLFKRQPNTPLPAPQVDKKTKNKHQKRNG